jgi:hypothetical protein
MRYPIALAAVLFVSTTTSAQIRVDPVTVNVNSQGASTVFLSYGSIRADQFSAEALWCADVIPATPDVGFKCDPASTWGRLPLRNDLARPSGRSGFTDIMTIPQNVIRRAYQRAERGGGGSFYYVRRFASATGQPDEYIAIVCQLAGRGANVPFALTDAKLRFIPEKNVLTTPVGEAPPPLRAEIVYTGTGRLIGRWEVVVPGDELPTAEDLVPEGSLPVEQRTKQRRYTQLERFNIYLPPTGRYELKGPDPAKLPVAVSGLYHVLLRIEASDDPVGNTDLAAVGEGAGIVTSGGVAGFSMPMLRYYVGSADVDMGRADAAPLALLAPARDTVVKSGASVGFEWRAVPAAAFYRVELSDSAGKEILAAIVEAPLAKYVAPPLTGDRAVSGQVAWRVLALDANGREIARSRLGNFRHGIAEEAAPPPNPQ